MDGRILLKLGFIAQAIHGLVVSKQIYGTLVYGGALFITHREKSFQAQPLEATVSSRD